MTDTVETVIGDDGSLHGDNNDADGSLEKDDDILELLNPDPNNSDTSSVLTERQDEMEDETKPVDNAGVDEKIDIQDEQHPEEHGSHQAHGNHSFKRGAIPDNNHHNQDTHDGMDNNDDFDNDDFDDDDDSTDYESDGASIMEFENGKRRLYVPGEKYSKYHCSHCGMQKPISKMFKSIVMVDKDKPRGVLFCCLQCFSDYGDWRRYKHRIKQF